MPEEPQLDPRALRNVLGCYATGVAVITASASAQPDAPHVAVTVNSFASVSLAPPLILFSLARNANILASFQATQNFSVNILSHTQEHLSNTFARPSSANWEDLHYTVGENGCALFSGCLAHLECSKSAELGGGDHIILLGQVTRLHLHDAADPLLFYRGRYGTYTRDLWGKLPPHDSTLNDFSVTGWELIRFCHSERSEESTV